MLVLQNIAYVVRCQLYERFQFERRVFEDDESACEKDAMDNQTCIARNLASSMCPVLAPQLRP